MKKNFNADRIIGLSAMLISLMTLIIFLYQTNLIKKQSVLSVRPRLTFSKNIDKTVTVNDSTNSTTISIRLTLRNNGLGPAIIESNKVIDKGETYEIMTFFDTSYPKLKEYGHFPQITELEIGEAIPASESIDIFAYQYNLDNEEKIKEYLDVDTTYEFPFIIAIEYSSMYEEKWQIQSDSKGHPKKIE